MKNSRFRYTCWLALAFTLHHVLLTLSPLTPPHPPPFTQLAKLNVEAQRVERELRDELANSVSREASDADRARISELEKAEAELRVEVSRCAGR